MIGPDVPARLAKRRLESAACGQRRGSSHRREALHESWL